MIDDLIVMKRDTYNMEFMEHLRAYRGMIEKKSVPLKYGDIDKTLYRGNLNWLLSSRKIPSSLWCISKVMSGYDSDSDFPKKPNVVVPNIIDPSYERYFTRIKEKLTRRKM